MLNLSHKAKRDLLTKMSYIRNTDGGLVVKRSCTTMSSDAPRHAVRSIPQREMNRQEVFGYNRRSENTRRLAGRLDKSAAFAPKG